MSRIHAVERFKRVRPVKGDEAKRLIQKGSAEASFPYASGNRNCLICPSARVEFPTFRSFGPYARRSFQSTLRCCIDKEVVDFSWLRTQLTKAVLTLSPFWNGDI